MSASTSQQPLAPAEPAPTTLLFARGLLALLDLWPALTIAVSEQWGGPESADKKTWLASTIIDLFEPSVPAPGAASAATSSASEAPIDFDDLADLINQIMSDEFEANIEDGSIDSVTGDILRLWKDITSTPEPTVLVDALERKAGDVQKKGVQAQKGAGPEELDMDGDDDDWSSEEDDMEVDGDAAPQLVPSSEPASRERQEPVVDEDGFTLVQKPRRR